MRVMLSWIGHTDLKAMYPSQSKKAQEIIAEICRGHVDPPKDGMGPVRTLVEVEKFDRIVLFNNYESKDIGKKYAEWLGVDADVRHVPIKNPTNYREVFVAADNELKSIVKGLPSGYTLDILLSPGTPTMAAVWVLLGKTRYPARFYQTWNSKATLEEIPFDIAMDFIPEVLQSADSALQHLASQSPREIKGFERIAGDSKAIRLAVGRAKKAAHRDVPILLTGESGTGKEMFARAIHDASHRHDKPFIPINCAAIPEQLMESEIFGHKKGAFSGAMANRDGAFKQADGGTLFLDEVGECSTDIQSKLLRVLQPPLGEGPCIREFTPLNGKKPERADVRVIAATNRNLLEMIDNAGFREDLFYRLAVITIKLPPLRERKSDIAAICEDLLGQINRDFQKMEPGYKHKLLSASAISFVARHAWPGNVRQLYNALLQSAVMSESDEIQEHDLVAALAEMPSRSSLYSSPESHPLGDGFVLEGHLNLLRKRYLERAMQESGGVKAEAARLLGMANYQTLDGQLKRLGVKSRKR